MCGLLKSAALTAPPTDNAAQLANPAPCNKVYVTEKSRKNTNCSVWGNGNQFVAHGGRQASLP